MGDSRRFRQEPGPSPRGGAEARLRARAADARDAAVAVLKAIEERDAFLQPAVDAEAQRLRLDPRDRGFALELVLGVTRWRNRLDHNLARCLRDGVEGTDPRVLRILRVGAYQLLMLEGSAAHAAVHRAVDQARAAAGEGFARLANGVLRRLQREGEVLPEGDEPEALAIRWGHPEWLVRRWLRYGADEAEAIALAHNAPAPLTIRPEPPALSREMLMERLTADGAEVVAGAYGPDAVHLRSLPAPFSSASFREGLWTAQDEASQLVVHLLDPQPGETVWDACAAPGGKTRYIARRMAGEGKLLATDAHERKAKRLARLLDDFDHVGVGVRDVREPPDARFDRVLVDAPCTGLGVIRRHPESKWRRTEADIADAAALQLDALRAAGGVVIPGGALVYSVCSDTEEEGPGVVSAFLAEADFEPDPPASFPVPLEGAALRLSPHRHGTDGFYAVRLRRRP